jgi:hypothetical protein
MRVGAARLGLVIGCVMNMLGGRAMAADPAAARALFEEGKRLSAEGAYEKACPKFEESLKLEPGIGTRFNLAECWEHVGRTATAWAEYLGVAGAAKAAGQAERERVARQRAAALEPRLSRLTIEVKEVDSNLEIRKDDAVVGRAAWGTAVPIDPGSHVVDARAPNKKAWRTTVDIPSDGRTVPITVPPLEAELGSPAGGVPALATSAPPTAVSTPTATTMAPISPASAGDAPNALATGGPETGAASDANGSRRIGAYSLLGGGALGLVVGTIFALQVNSKNSDASSICKGTEGNCPDPMVDQRESLLSDARGARTVSYVGFIAGGAALAAGAVVLLTIPPSGSSSSSRSISLAPIVGMGTAGTLIQGAW